MEFHSQAGGRFTLTQTLCSSSGEEFTMQPFRWDFVGKNMVFMAVEGFVYFILNLLMQYQFFSGRWYETGYWEINKHIYICSVLQHWPQVLPPLIICLKLSPLFQDVRA